MKKEIGTYQMGDMRLIYEQDEEMNTGIVLIPDSCSNIMARQKDYKAEPLVQLKIAGDDYPFGFSQGRTMRNSESTGRLAFVSQQFVTEQGRTRIDTYLKDSRGIHCCHQVSYDERSQALEITTTITNKSSRDITVEMISSFTLGAIPPFDDEAEEGQLILHRLLSTWSAEGRLESRTVEEMQLEPSWQKFSANCFRYGQVGSMPVRGFVPFAAVEDRKNHVVWGVSLYHGSSWQIEAYRRDEALILSGGLADREFGQWYKTLKQGDSFETPKALVTTAEGDLDEVTGRLTENIRKNLKLPRSESGKMPIIFNEFCTSWGGAERSAVDAYGQALKGTGHRIFCY